MTRTIAAALLALVCASCASVPAAPPQSARTAEAVIARWRRGEAINAVLLGGSVSTGLYADNWKTLQFAADDALTASSAADERVASVASQLGRLIRSRNSRSVFSNASHRSWSAGMYASASGAETLQRVIAGPVHYDIAFIAMQVDDADRGADLDEFKAQHTSIIDKIAGVGIAVVIVKENAISSVSEARFGVPYRAYVDAVDAIASARRLPIVDGYTPFRDAIASRGSMARSRLFYDDEMFPNQAGHDLLFAAYANFFGVAPPPPRAMPTAESVRAKWQRGEPIKAVIIGNSIGVGYYASGWERLQLAPDNALTAASAADDSVRTVAVQLRQLIRSKNSDSVLVNESRNGWDTAMMLGLTAPKIDVIGRIAEAAPHYDIAFLPLQINDINHGYALPVFQAQYEQIIIRLSRAGIVVVPVKENDIYGALEARFGISYAAMMREVDAIAADWQLSVVDTYTPFHDAIVQRGGIEQSGLFQDEGLHPNQAGHDMLFAAYKKWFETQ